MDEFKKSLKALDPQIKLIIWGGLAIICFVLFGVLDVCGNTNGFEMLTEASDLLYGAILLTLFTICMMVLPIAGIALTLLKKKIIATPAYIYAGIAFFILVFFDFKLVEGIYWLTFVMSLIWAFLSYLLSNDEVDFTASK